MNVVEEVKAVEAAVEKALVELLADEKLALRSLENEYLKANVRMQQIKSEFENLQKSASEIQTKFTTSVEYLTKQYLADAKIGTKHLFDALELVFKKAA